LKADSQSPVRLLYRPKFQLNAACRHLVKTRQVSVVAAFAILLIRTEPTVEAGLHLSGDISSRTYSNEESVFFVMKHVLLGGCVLDLFHYFIS